ncbi:methylmalonate semialdehyde dehydrogenase [acylating] 2 [Ktedonobacter sp. SOSP1-85]|uniref:CoA-acylating methylmalonate-semialdehyde dehydrogenase n=1 Tax=Ktedonobacter sp. SOSP1-85 TaxID=2778367 RepID=UPI0019151A1F|nr:CoA-acylating methylmalonate-semialdehyde dehydrogenase [Ktedonobacter sp. SOSP1-85]GHO79814.1 methylmalonate semialdehyde dehydrogenase [acylating] 2 [Ktedonobacter sp. SOSP1-85]
MTQHRQLMNYIGGQWTHSRAAEYLPVRNPATDELLAHVPLSPAVEVDTAVQAAQAAFDGWRRTPPTERIQYLFKFKQLLEEHSEEIAHLTTQECGKTLAEAQGELLRGIENVEVATGIPSLMMGYNLEDIASGIDEHMFRQPVGVVAAITPFNFPGMIPLWFLPYAIACGNCFILKPSEKVPLTMARVFELIDQLGLPTGVVSLVNGGKETVDALLDHPLVRAISFVGSSPVAKYVYSRAAANGKRAQCQGGAKNTVIVLPDADMEMTTRIVADSSFGCAGQRCLATSVAITVGEARTEFRERLTDAAVQRKVGSGLDSEVEMGPVITPESKQRIESLIAKGAGEGAELLVDGRNTQVKGYERGYFVRPTLLDNLAPQSELARTEIFGPVLSLIHVQDIDAAIELINASPFGNMACLFTNSGAAARKFRYEARVGNIGINVGVAAPMAFFPFTGWKDSFFGDMHAQGRDAIEFYTEKKVVVERWPREWSRKF